MATYYAHWQPNPRVTRYLRTIAVEEDTLEVIYLDEDERISAWRYLIYRFLAHTTTTNAENDDLRILLMEQSTRDERARLIETLKEVHRRHTRSRLAKVNQS